VAGRTFRKAGLAREEKDCGVFMLWASGVMTRRLC
jgi:hypothetical protein